jgi:hypothetical protein
MQPFPTDSRYRLPLIPVVPSTLATVQDYVLCEPATLSCDAIRDFIRQRYAASFGARLEQFMPHLYSLCGPRQEIVGAFGLRHGDQPFFLEHYLDQPVEVAIARQIGRPVDRSRIVEVGQFAGDGPGAMRALIGALTDHLHRRGVEWVVFTGTIALRNAFKRLGLQPRVLGQADPSCLPADARAAWGSYYTHSPLVLFGNVSEGALALGAQPGPFPARQQ